MNSTRDCSIRPAKISVRVLTLAAIGCGMATLGATGQNQSSLLSQRAFLLGIPPDLSDRGFDTTNFDTDIAIEGSGFLKVQLQDRAAYTRLGSLFLNQTGRLGVCTGNNFYPLLPAIHLPVNAGNIAVKIDGSITYSLAGVNGLSAADKIALWRFSNPRGLRPIGERLFIQTRESQPPTKNLPGHCGAGYLRSGYLERSDADPLRDFPASDGM